MQTLTITRPDDWHIHLRSGAALQHTVKDAAKQFARAIVMPNLVPPVTNVEEADDYRQAILRHASERMDFEPLMTLYLTDNTSVEDIEAAVESGFVKACKLYPAGATTNSDSGLTDIENAYPVFEKMAEVGMPLLVHGEVTDGDIDIFDREKVFIDTKLRPVVEKFPQLKVVLEHITTKDAVEFVNEQGPNVAATITAHHLLLNRNDMLVGGIRPHLYCLPILKRQEHQAALLVAATSGSPKFFLGTDSAPHAKSKKEAACGCAGVYTAYAAIELYAEAFEMMGKLDKLEAFASFYGPDFYGLPRNEQKITLVKEEWKIPSSICLGNDHLVPFRADETLQWKLKTKN
ncbi:dihydroorotase [Kangiella shandongensis]|uniref:dihydroorotase n=1 Tax=Kangiella shandongensis TaxID=2763258 RepID=UPI001CBBEB27|nr:dihydroorotase [Kangiella shandongensis]